MGIQVHGCALTADFIQQDFRGSFRKVLSDRRVDEAGRLLNVEQVFFSTSRLGVVRGLHVSAPPNEGRKLVFVLEGEVIDWVLDLRIDSPSQGVLQEISLSRSSGCLLIPAGCAHGFEVSSATATMGYIVEGDYSAETDLGVEALSAGCRIRSEAPIRSRRDLGLPALDTFMSPFRWRG